MKRRTLPSSFSRMPFYSSLSQSSRSAAALVVSESAHLPPLVSPSAPPTATARKPAFFAVSTSASVPVKTTVSAFCDRSRRMASFQHRPAANGAACLALGQKTAEVSLDPRRTQQRLRFGAVERRDGVEPHALHFQDGEHLVRAWAQAPPSSRASGK